MEPTIIGQDERIQEVVRRHWINIAPIAAVFGLVSLAAVFGFYLLGRYGESFGGSGSMPLAALGLLAVLALGFLLAYTSWWVYRQNRLIVTDKNLYQVTQNSLFSRQVAQFSLERLQDVSASQNGFFASMFDYGDVTIETAGEEDNFIFHSAPQPQKLAGWIMSCHKRAIAEPPATHGTS
jgi:uncharacterized membrane protein YdbT with pleckstrin-like domain